MAAAPGVQLIPSPEEIMQILKKTGAFREGHFVYPNGKHTAHYFQMPLAFRYYDTARVLAVALSRKFRVNRDQSEFRRNSSCFRRARRAERATDLLGRAGERQAHVSPVCEPGRHQSVHYRRRHHSQRSRD